MWKIQAKMTEIIGIMAALIFISMRVSLFVYTRKEF